MQVVFGQDFEVPKIFVFELPTSSLDLFLFSYPKFHPVFVYVFQRRLRLMMQIYVFCTIRQVSRGCFAFRGQSSKSVQRGIFQVHYLGANQRKEKPFVMNFFLYQEMISAMVLVSGEFVLTEWLIQLSSCLKSVHSLVLLLH